MKGAIAYVFVPYRGKEIKNNETTNKKYYRYYTVFVPYRGKEIKNSYEREFDTTIYLSEFSSPVGEKRLKII